MSNEQLITPPTDTRGRPLHDDISKRAEELWHGYGRPAGRDEEIWLEAERQLLGADAQVAQAGSGTADADDYHTATGANETVQPLKQPTGGATRSRNASPESPPPPAKADSTPTTAKRKAGGRSTKVT